MPTDRSSPTTCLSLIHRVRDLDPEAWQTLSTLYAPMVYRWARQAGLLAEDSADIVQNVFVAVFRSIGRFSKDGGGSFRAWLWTITRNSSRQHYRQIQGAPLAAGGSDAHQRLCEQPDLLDRESAPDDSEAELALLEEALRVVQETVDGRTWEAFQRTAIGDESAVEVGEVLGMTPKAVRQAKYRVLCQLRALLADRL